MPNNIYKDKSLVIVLGMHRAGTSVITRALQTLGVDLGVRLLPPSPDNPKGYFEDIDVIEINQELLRLAEHDWHTCGPIFSEVFYNKNLVPIFAKAVALLSSRLNTTNLFGIKDPRISRLLPFWQVVFSHLGVKTYYVIASRNPLSVINSIAKRDRFTQEKCLNLWLEHIIPSILYSSGFQRVVVDYDMMLSCPEKQVKRIASSLGDEFNIDSLDLTGFCKDFIDTSLRHKHISEDQVDSTSELVKDVLHAYNLLSDISADLLSIDSDKVGRFFNKACSKHHNVSFQETTLRIRANLVSHKDPSFDALVSNIAFLYGEITDKDRHIGNLEPHIERLELSLTEQNKQIQNLSQLIIDKDRHIGNLEPHIERLEHSLSERNEQVQNLSQLVANKDRHIGNLEPLIERLELSLAEQNKQIQNLSQLIVDKDRHIGNLEPHIERLELSLTEKNKQIQNLSQQIADKDRHIGNLEPHIERLEHSLSERNEQVQNLSQLVADKDRHIGNLKPHIERLEHSLSERNEQIQNLSQLVTDKNRRISNLESHIERLEFSLSERNEQVQSLSQMVTDKDRHIGNLEPHIERLELSLQKLNEQVSQLNQLVKIKEATIQQVSARSAIYHFRFNQLRNKMSSRIIGTFDSFRHAWYKLSGSQGLSLVPFNQLRKEGSLWESTGNDPQFLLVADSSWVKLAGWHTFEINCKADKPLSAQIFLDTGEGFTPTCVIDFQLNGNGPQEIPLVIPHGCKAIRFDPCNEPLKFRLSDAKTKKLKGHPKLADEFLRQSEVYATLSKFNAELAPANDIETHNGDSYDWCSIGADPYFLVTNTHEFSGAGWYLIELALRSEIGRGNTKIYPDYGDGYSEDTVIGLPFSSETAFERVCKLPSIPKRLRMDPLEHPGAFSVDKFSIMPITAESAHFRMIQHLIKTNGDAVTPEHFLKKLHQDAKLKEDKADELLYGLYNHTYKMIGIHDSGSYAEWIAKYETPLLPSLKGIDTEQEVFSNKPTISIIMPVYNTPESLLRKAIESVIEQSYGEWQLCIADDLSNKGHVRGLLQEYASRDERIRVFFRTANGHISEASNSALELATGEYVALLDHDDELAKHALHYVVAEINRQPNAKIFYSDEDKIDLDGNRSEPHFKSDWNPDLFFSQNYISHLGVYRRDLLIKIGGFRKGYEGSQDHDLLLRCLPYVRDAEIIHISKILYHWRIVEGSTALDAGEKTYTSKAAIMSLRDFFEKQGLHDIEVSDGLVPNTYRIKYPIPPIAPLVSLLIPTRDKLELLEPCIRSILDKTDYSNYEILILDNGSTEIATHEYFKQIQCEDSRIRVLPYPNPFNFSAINNFGVRYAQGEIIGLINNDLKVLNSSWLTEMVSHALRPEIGCVGAKLYYDDETIQHAGVIVGLGGVAGHSHKYFPKESSGYFHRLKLVQNLSAVTAACLLVRKSVYEEVGGLEEEHLAVAFNDVDFCLKVLSTGYRNIWTPYAEMYHYESKSRGHEDTPEKIARFNKEVEFMKSKWQTTLEHDNYYNINLTTSREDFSMR